MSSTVFTDYQTPVVAAWLNDVNAAVYPSGGGAPVNANAVGQLSGRNVIINGDCSISQVNGGSLITPVNGSWPIDMVSYISTQVGKLQVQQVSNKLNSLGTVYSRTYSVLSSFISANTDSFEDLISIEGFNFAQFQYGTANAKAGSLQFKVTASVAGTYSGSICNYAGSRSYPFTFTVAANTDTLIQIPNIPGDTGGSWVGATNAGAAYIRMDLGSGTNYKSTANSWQTGNFIGVTGTTNLVSQVNGSTLTITDVQFEVGSVCTQFERKLYGQNLMECQRYLQIFGATPTGIGYMGGGYATSTSQLYINIPIYCAMRAYPSISYVGTSFAITTQAANSPATAIVAGATPTLNNISLLVTGSGTPYVAGAAGQMSCSNPNSFVIASSQI